MFRRGTTMGSAQPPAHQEVQEVEVAVVGCGPVGALTANLLGARGVSTLVVERSATPHGQPRAFSCDDEALRIYQQAGLLDEVRDETIAPPLVEYVNGAGRVFARMKLSETDFGYGHAPLRFFDQPRLERTLRAGLDRFPHVRLALGTELVGLTQSAGTDIDDLSGGQRQRLAIGCALVHEPEVLFLDEPTTGLDPRARAALWETISELVAGGGTLLLTTQYMEEADHLADRILVVDQGRAIADGTADELKDRIGGNRIELTAADAADLEAARRVLERSPVGTIRTVPESLQLIVSVIDGPGSLHLILGRLADAGIRVRDAGLRRPTLDDVYLSLTGRQASGADPRFQEATR